MTDFKTIDELINYTKQIVGKKFKDFDKDGLIKNGLKDKGILGKIIETGFYGYPNNNKAEADFNDLGVELKVSGYIKNANGTISAKERVKLGQINYSSIVNEEFSYSKLISKCKRILIIWYEYDKNKEAADYVITKFQLYDMSGDELIIKNDFEIIKEKVVKGNAHLISEGDTSYLGACTSSSTSNVTTLQPFSNIPAKPRAFSLKNAYMTGILRSINLTLEVDNQEYKTIEEYVFAQIQKFIGETQINIFEKLTSKKYENKIPKQLNKMISDIAIGKDKDLPKKNQLFLKTNYIIKNLPVNKLSFPIERMAFRNLLLSDFEETWENSSWKTYFEEITIIVLCYEGSSKIKNGFRTLKDMRKISFNESDIELFGRTYSKVKEAIEQKNINKLPIPTRIKGLILELAPKGQKGDDAYNHFLDKNNTDVCFMLNKDFLFKKLNEDVRK